VSAKTCIGCNIDHTFQFDGTTVQITACQVEM
jgi:hypothetical protein